MVRLHAGVTLGGNTWQSIVGAGPGADSARVAFTRLPSGLWQKKIRPSAYFGRRADTIQQLCFVLNGGPATDPWAREGKRRDAANNCQDFNVSFPIQGQIAGQPVLPVNIAPAGPIVLCSADSAILTAATSASARVQWRRDGQPLPADTFRTLVVRQFGTYSAVATSGDSLGQSNDVSITIRPPVTPPTATASFTCAGTASILTARGAQGNANYEWYDSDTSRTLLAMGAVFTTTPLQDTTLYYVLIRQDGCPSQRQGVVVEVAPAPDTPRFSGNSLLCAPGGAFSIQVLTLPPDPVVRWYADSLRRTLLDSGLIFQRSVSQTTRYWAEARLGFCRSATVPLTINVSPLPPAPAIRQQDTLLIAPSGYISYAWSFNGQPLPTTADTLGPQDEGLYSLVVVDTNGCASPAGTINYIRTQVAAALSGSVRAYPNPSADGIFQLLGVAPEVQVRVYNSTGAVVYQGKAAQGIDLSALPAGLYWALVAAGPKRIPLSLVKGVK